MLTMWLTMRKRLTWIAGGVLLLALWLVWLLPTMAQVTIPPSPTPPLPVPVLPGNSNAAEATAQPPLMDVINPTTTPTPPPTLALHGVLPLGSITPTITPGGVLLQSVNGMVRYQNRPLDNRIQIYTLDFHQTILFSVAYADSQGRFTIHVPVNQQYWLLADAPLHRRAYVLLMPGDALPPIILPGGDVNGDRCISQADVDLLVAQFEQPGSTHTDINGDGITNAADLAILTGNFDPMCVVPAPPPTATMTLPAPLPPMNTPIVIIQDTPQDMAIWPEQTPDIVPPLASEATVTPTITLTLPPPVLPPQQTPIVVATDDMATVTASPPPTQTASAEVTPEIHQTEIHQTDVSATPTSLPTWTATYTATATPTYTATSSKIPVTITPTSTVTPTWTVSPTTTFTPTPTDEVLSHNPTLTATVNNQ